MGVLEDIREMLYKELECMAQQEITKGNLEIIDKLTHSLKSIDTIIAMNEYSEYDDGGNEYSRRGNMNSNRYDGGYSYNMRGSSYRYGRGGQGGQGGRNSYNSSHRGRYSREDSKEKMIEKLEDYMDSVESEKIKDSIQRVIHQIESEG